jgi:hypothetical protein
MPSRERRVDDRVFDDKKRIAPVSGRNQNWEECTVPKGYEYEQCYVAEISHFLKYLKGEASWVIPFELSVDMVHVLEAILESVAKREIVRVNR